MTSIRSYLVTVLIALLTLTSFLAALQGYRHSSEQAGRMFDEDLQVLAASLLDLYQEAPSAAPALLPSDVYQSGLNAVQVFRQGQLIYRNHSAPARPIDVASGFSEQNFLGQRWRTYRIEDAASGLTVISAQPLHGRQNLADEVVLASIYPVVLSLPLQVLLIWWVVSRGLQPLRRLAEQLSAKKADDLSPLTLDDATAPTATTTATTPATDLQQTGTVPRELVPVLHTTNHLLARLRLAFEREKRFAADVAHELRTPLSVLQVQLFNAEQRWLEAKLPVDELSALKGGVERMSQLIEQILLLNRTNPEQFHARLQQLDLAELCRTQIVELYPQFERKQQDIALLCDEPIVLMADAFALPLLVRNLLGNANKYAPEGGAIQLQLVQIANASVQLTVADSGPGIAEDEYDKVFQRFYRVGGDRQRETGSGLGLAICQEITSLHQGQLQLGRSVLGGLQVTVTLPLQQSATLSHVGMTDVSQAPVASAQPREA